MEKKKDENHESHGPAEFMCTQPLTRSRRLGCDAGALLLHDKCAPSDGTSASLTLRTSFGVGRKSTRSARAPFATLDDPAPSDLEDEEDGDSDPSSDVADDTPTLRPRSGIRNAKRARDPARAPRRVNTRPRAAALSPAAVLPQAADAAPPETFECACCFSRLRLRDRVVPADCACAAGAGRFCAGCVRGWVDSQLDSKVSPRPPCAAAFAQPHCDKHARIAVSSSVRILRPTNPPPPIPPLAHRA